jgi:hypothetical protein
LTPADRKSALLDLRNPVQQFSVLSRNLVLLLGQSILADETDCPLRVYASSVNRTVIDADHWDAVKLADFNQQDNFLRSAWKMQIGVLKRNSHHQFSVLESGQNIRVLPGYIYLGSDASKPRRTIQKDFYLDEARSPRRSRFGKLDFNSSTVTPLVFAARSSIASPAHSENVIPSMLAADAKSSCHLTGCVSVILPGTIEKPR